MGEVGGFPDSPPWFPLGAATLALLYVEEGVTGPHCHSTSAEPVDRGSDSSAAHSPPSPVSSRQHRVPRLFKIYKNPALDHPLIL